MSQSLQLVVKDRAADMEAHKARILPGLEKKVAKAENLGRVRVARSLRWAMCELRDNNNISPYRCIRGLVRMPVTIEEFVNSKKFIGAIDDFDVWPYWQRELVNMNPDVICGEEPVTEIVLGGASGTGKSKVAQISIMYGVYVLSCFDTPSAVFPDYDGTSPLMVPIVSHKPTITRDIFYTPMRKTLEAMPYVQRHMPWDKNRDAAMHFIKQNVTIQPFLAMDTALSGQAIFQAILDEMNFMDVIERSTRTPGPRGLGGRFDQAELVYKEASSRRTRPPFGSRDLPIGKMCVMSNTRYQGDFIDRHMAKLEQQGTPGVYSKRLMRQETSPDDLRKVEKGYTIRVLVGAPGYSSRVLEDDEVAGEDYSDDALIMQVPDSYEAKFKYDADNELRLVCGITTGVISPYLSRREMIAGAFSRGERLNQWVDECDVDLTERGLPEWVPENMPDDKEAPRFIHVDLSISKDRCGVAVIKVAGMSHVVDSEHPDVTERAPHYVVEMAVSIKPSGTAQIDPGEIRSWLMELGTVHGLNVSGVSYDGFQSSESIQRWRKAGLLNVRLVSMDRTTQPYDHFRRALYQGRVDIVAFGMLSKELLELEYNAEKDKVDHPPRGTKDIADAVAGAVFNASETRSVRSGSGYVDSDTGDRVRVRLDGRVRKKGQRQNRRMSLKERNRIKWSTGEDPWDL